MKSDGFDATHWSIVLLAATDSPAGDDALAQLCEAYRLPLYAYLRRRYETADAEDLLQDFFARQVVTRAIFKNVKPDGRPFRAWLIGALQNSVSNTNRARNAEIRGGKAWHVAFDVREGERHYHQIADPALTPEQHFHRSWAITLLTRAHELLALQYERSGRAALFRALEGKLPGGANARSYPDLARELGKTEEAVRVAVKRLRDSHRALLRKQVAQTVVDRADIDHELRDLIGYLP